MIKVLKNDGGGGASEDIIRVAFFVQMKFQSNYIQMYKYKIWEL